MARALYPALSLLIVGLLTVPAGAHPSAPATVSLVEKGERSFAVRFVRDARLEPLLALRLPEHCTASDLQRERAGEQTVDRLQLRCNAPLTGQTIGLTGLTRAEPSGILHIQYRKAESARALLTFEQPSFRIAARSAPAQTVWQFTKLGAEHLCRGLDHLLFTAGLLLLGYGARALWLLTAFTLGHSTSLALVCWHGLLLPRMPVELGIALSLIALALHVLSRTREHDAASARRSLPAPAALTFAVGLLHGLGFADGLSQLAVPSEALWPALLGFNLGVELAQLLFVCALWPCLWLAQTRSQAALRLLQRSAGYTIGSLAALWCIERTLLLFN